MWTRHCEAETKAMAQHMFAHYGRDGELLERSLIRSGGSTTPPWSPPPWARAAGRAPTRWATRTAASAARRIRCASARPPHAQRLRWAGGRRSPPAGTAASPRRASSRGPAAPQAAARTPRARHQRPASPGLPHSRPPRACCSTERSSERCKALSPRRCRPRRGRREWIHRPLCRQPPLGLFGPSAARSIALPHDQPSLFRKKKKRKKY
mmetsp:Transcript_21851/g.44293  ORF Transcript_21851/g.44293 Transcript_21851/m.44293 type:complete len:209 (-) Transcript_21851:14-640(-)